METVSHGDTDRDIEVIEDWQEIGGVKLRLIITSKVTCTCIVFGVRYDDQPLVFAPSKVIAEEGIASITGCVTKHLFARRVPATQTL